MLCWVREAACCDISGEICPTPSGAGGDAFATVVFEAGGVGGGAGCFCAFVAVFFRRLIGEGFCGLVGSGVVVVVAVVVEGCSAVGVVVSGLGVGAV